MNETQRRIKAYKAALPGLKERVFAVAIMLAMSVAMMTSATFAWLTISRRPEVSEINTNVAANGNLEIALVAGDGTVAPGDSQLGDSTGSYHGKQLVGYEFTDAYINNSTENPDGLTYGFSEDAANYKKDAEGNPIPVEEDVYQGITDSNVTWGNLVNLSDPSYGLENLTLRPARLNTYDLLGSPLYGAAYGQDGRIVELDSSFAYTTWIEPTADREGRFVTSDLMGVRAISSTQVDAVGPAARYLEMVQGLDSLNNGAAEKYADIGTTSRYMEALGALVSAYLDLELNGGDPSISEETIKAVVEMYDVVLEAYKQEATGIAAIINLNQWYQNGDIPNTTTPNYVEYTWRDVYNLNFTDVSNGTDADPQKPNGNPDVLDVIGYRDPVTGVYSIVTIKELQQFVNDWKTMEEDQETLRGLIGSGTIKWNESGIDDIVSNLVYTPDCLLNGTKISALMADKSGAISSVLKNGAKVTITNGILKNFEERTGGRLNASVPLKVKYSGMTVPITATVFTNADKANFYMEDKAAAIKNCPSSFAGGAELALDTYGMAIDLWVRTNAAGSALMLEGNVLTESEEVPATTLDANGNTVDVYTVKYTMTSSSETDETVTGETTATEGTDETVTITLEVYKSKTTDENGAEVDCWRNATTHAVIDEETLGDAEPTQKIVEKVTVLGYEGENRIWGENTMLSTDATTQGSGSCYVYYADTPEDQARSLKLLQAFNVAFIDEKGNLLAEAIMNTDRHYAESGRVTVPLELAPESGVEVGTDEKGNKIYGITALEKNVPTRITALVYLDGAKLENKDVLAASDIQGQLNIQFGSSQVLQPIENDDLANKIRRVTAEVETTSFDFDNHVGDMKTKVSVSVEGDEPAKVTAFFMRAISDTQGSREKSFTFTKNQDTGKWEAEYTFTSPGNYILRTIQLDGVDYDLTTPPKVTITGFAVDSLRYTSATTGKNHVSVMSAAVSSSADLELKFGTDDPNKMPKTVQGLYLRDDGSAVNVNFQYNATTAKWEGRATFLSSGEYVMKHLILDGEYYELAESMWQTAHVILGLRVSVYTSSPVKIVYNPAEMAPNEKNLQMQVKITDDTGTEMQGLENVWLHYSAGSGRPGWEAELSWNGTYYVGEMPNEGPGIWRFSNVIVGSNVLTTARTYPEFTVQSPEPPEYVGHTTTGYQYAPSNGATMNVIMSNAQAVSISAKIVSDRGNEQWVTYRLGANSETNKNVTPTQIDDTTTMWTFNVPTNIDGFQDGTWMLTDLKVWDAYAPDGTAYTEEAPLEFDMTGENNITYVLCQVRVAFQTDVSQNFTGSFLDTKSVEGISVAITDAYNEPLTYTDADGKEVDMISDVKMEFSYVSGSSKSYGGYTNSEFENTPADQKISVNLVNTDGGTTYLQDGDVTFRIAGNYNTRLSFKLNGTEVALTNSSAATGITVLGNIPKFSLTTTKPTVKITAISPTGKFSYDNANSNVNNTYKSSWGTYTCTLSSNHIIQGATTSISETNATVYFRCDHSDEESWKGYGAFGAHTGLRYHNYTRPSVTMTLSGITAGVTAELKFGDNVQLYNGTTQTTGYSWTEDGTCVRNVGGYTSQSLASDIKIPAGKITATKLELTAADGQVYTVTVNITINNPY